jgi:hypothetical protein
MGMEKMWDVQEFSALDFQKDVFEYLSKSELNGFSLHMPTNNNGYQRANDLKDRWGCLYHAYDKLFFEDFKYLSDSGGNWREGHWGKFVNEYELIQVLTHPVWHYKIISQENY